MTDTKLEYKGKGFWIAESFMQLTLCYISEEISKPQYGISNKNEILKDLDMHIQGITCGCMSVGLFRYTNSFSDEQVMIQVLQNVKQTLKCKGKYITSEELLLLPTEDFYLRYILDRDLSTIGIIKTIETIIQLLEGTWESNNYNMDIHWTWKE